MASAKERGVERLFVCVDPPPEAVNDLGHAVDQLEVARADAPGRSTRLSARDRWHVTLAFLGDVEVRRIARVCAALDEAAAGLTPVAIRIAGGGTFGHGEMTILWAALGGDVDALQGLAEAVRAELRRRWIPFDGKAFRPHLTIARPGARVASALVARDVDALNDYVGPVWTVEQLRLVSSTQGPRPSYTTVYAKPLPATQS